jgi:hypothetical protein
MVISKDIIRVENMKKGMSKGGNLEKGKIKRIMKVKREKRYTVGTN